MNHNKKPPVGKGPVGGGPMGGGPMGGMMGGGAKAKDFKGTLRQLMQYLSKYRFAIALVVIFAAGSTIFSIVGPKTLGKATSEIFAGFTAKIAGTGGIDFSKIGTLLLTLLGLYIISLLFSMVQGFVMTGVSQKVTYNLRKDLSEKVAKLPMGYFDSRNHGEVLSVITNDVDTLSQSLNQSLTQIITSFCTIVGIFAMMLSISWQMTLIAVLTLPLSLGVVGVVVKRSQKYFRAQQTYLATVNGQVEEVYGGHTVVRAFNGEKAALDAFIEQNNHLYQSGWKSQFLSGLMMPIMGFIGNLGYVMVAVLGGYLAAKRVISVGDIQAFIQYTRQFTQPISQVAQVSNLLQSTMASAERIFAFLNEIEEEKGSERVLDLEVMNGDVTFDHVRFGYSPEKMIVNDFSAQVKDGQRVAIVGPTGAGKTTMVKLLMRFYELNGGAIRVAGEDITSFQRSELRKLFGMVLQDTWLFNGTIMENIRYGRLDATDAEVVAAAKAAHVHHFVKTLPDGYNMVLNEEASNISQGQKQLLTIARAILADPTILILDEATSSVDTRTEILIQKAMENLMKDRTSFVIAHRLSTIKDSDIILVMKDGDIIEQGNHQELILKNGFYAQLYNSQFEKAG